MSTASSVSYRSFVLHCKSDESVHAIHRDNLDGTVARPETLNMQLFEGNYVLTGRTILAAIMVWRSGEDY